MKSGLEDRNNRLRRRPRIRARVRVSMKSGLEDRNNQLNPVSIRRLQVVSMKSGLEDRNNEINGNVGITAYLDVSMKSGLEDRNNGVCRQLTPVPHSSLNEVRPGRPEQCTCCLRGLLLSRQVSMKSGLEDRNNLDAGLAVGDILRVSMKSGLEDRNNWIRCTRTRAFRIRLNEVRPGRPEQSLDMYGNPTEFITSQ